MALGGPGGARGPGGQGGPARALKKRPARSLKSARCTLSQGGPNGQRAQGEEVGVYFRDQHWSRGEPAPAGRGCYRPHGCGEAGKRIGSLCAIEVEGLKRRPPTEVGGLSLEFRV